MEENAGPDSEGMGGPTLEVLGILNGVQFVEDPGDIPHMFCDIIGRDETNSSISGPIDRQRGINVRSIPECNEALQNAVDGSNRAFAGCLTGWAEQPLDPVFLILLGAPFEPKGPNVIDGNAKDVCPTEFPTIFGAGTHVVDAEGSGLASFIEGRFGRIGILCLSLSEFATSKAGKEANGEPVG
jgi:hypothetical protein